MNATLEVLWEQAKTLFTEGRRADALVLQLHYINDYSSTPPAPFDIVYKMDLRASLYLQLFPYLSTSNQDKALAYIWAELVRLQDEPHSIREYLEAFPIIGPRLSYEQWGFACTLVNKFTHLWSRSHLINTIAPYLGPLQLERVYSVAETIENDGTRVSIIADLARYFPESRHPDILAEILAFPREQDRAYGLLVLFPVVNEEIQATIVEKWFALSEPSTKANIWSRAIPHLSERDLIRLYEMALSLQSDTMRWYLLSSLWRRLPTRYLGEVYQMAQGIQQDTRRAYLLYSLIPALPEYKTELMHTIRTIIEESPDSDAEFQVGMLINLLPHFSPAERCDVVEEVLAQVHTLEEVSDQSNAYALLVPYLNPNQMEQVWTRISNFENIPDEYLSARAEGFAKLATQLVPAGWSPFGYDCLREVMKNKGFRSTVKPVVEALCTAATEQPVVAFDIWSFLLRDVVTRDLPFMRYIVDDWFALALALAGDEKYTFADAVFPIVAGWDIDMTNADKFPAL